MSEFLILCQSYVRVYVRVFPVTMQLMSDMSDFFYLYAKFKIITNKENFYKNICTKSDTFDITLINTKKTLT